MGTAHTNTKYYEVNHSSDQTVVSPVFPIVKIAHRNLWGSNIARGRSGNSIMSASTKHCHLVMIDSKDRPDLLVIGLSTWYPEEEKVGGGIEKEEEAFSWCSFGPAQPVAVVTGTCGHRSMCMR